LQFTKGRNFPSPGVPADLNRIFVNADYASHLWKVNIYSAGQEIPAIMSKNSLWCSLKHSIALHSLNNKLFLYVPFIKQAFSHFPPLKFTLIENLKNVSLRTACLDIPPEDDEKMLCGC
jgi:hypothetical protein